MKKLKCFLVLVAVMCGMVLLFQPAVANDITYVSSILWTDAEDVQVVGDYAYCAFRNGLLIFDVSDPANPSFVSRFYLSGEGRGIFVKNSYVYLADSHEGLVIFDVSNPASPDSVGNYVSSGGVGDVFVRDSLAYVAYGGSGLQIINISDPTDPDSVGSCDTPGSGLRSFRSGQLSIYS